MQSRETQITMVKWTNAGGQTKRANERSFVCRPPAWRRWRNVKTTYTCPVRSPSLCVQGKLLFSTFLTRNEGTTDESKKRLGCYQQEQFNLPREYSVFDGSQCIINNRKFELWRRRESQIKNSLTMKNNNFARASRFFHICFAGNCTTTRENA